MLRLIAATVVCVFLVGSLGPVIAAPVSEAVVDEACGDNIEGGCTASTCATGCEKMEGGKMYSYGCIFPNKTGKTKATCSKEPLGRTKGDSRTTGIGDRRPVLKRD
jgi:hypothetical protein